MLVHLHRNITTTWLGKTRYSLSAAVHAELDERDIIARHNLDRLLIFADPCVEQLLSAADHAHIAARGRGFFVTGVIDAASVTTNEIRSVVATLRAARAFDLTLGDLLIGITIEHVDLSAIRETEQVIEAAVDRIDQTIQSARRYTQRADDLLVPGNEPANNDVPTQQWARGWRR